MLIVKAHAVCFERVGARALCAPRAFGMMHDESGRAWPRCSVLVGPYTRAARTARLDAAARRYFGDAYRAHSGTVRFPPRALSLWEPLGEARRIFYVRVGDRFGGEAFQHKFKRRRFFFLFPSPARLFGHGDFVRLELPRGCIVNERGFVVP